MHIREVLAAIDECLSVQQAEGSHQAVTLTAVENHLRQMDSYHEIPRLRFGQEEVFKQLWALGIPIVVDLQARFEGIWTPAILKNLYGSEDVTMLTVGTHSRGDVTSQSVKLSTFFERFEEAVKQDKWAVKMKACVHADKS